MASGITGFIIFLDERGRVISTGYTTPRYLYSLDKCPFSLSLSLAPRHTNFNARLRDTRR